MSDLSWSQIARRFAAALRQPMGRAIAVAAGFTLVLAVAVLAVWSVDPGAGGDEGTTLSATLLSPAAGDAGPTPTPRIVATRPPRTATAAAASTAAAPTAAAAPSPAPSPTVATQPAPPTGVPPDAAPAGVTSTAAVATERTPFVIRPAPTREEGPAIAPPSPPTGAAASTEVGRPTATSARPTTSPTPEPLYLAENAADFARMATGSWAVAADRLVNEAAPRLPESWTVVPAEPDEEAFAVEVELRVQELDRTVCGQSAGLVVGSTANARFIGAGVHFPCTPALAIGAPRARLTDVSEVANGYNADPLIDDAAFDPGSDWRTYRVEVRDTRFTLLIDGEAALAGDGVPAADQIGLWTQGARVEVRRLAVLPLDGEND